MIEIEIEGLTELRAGLENVEDLITEGILEGVGRALMSIEDDAKMLCPVDTGALRESIHSDWTQKDGGAEGYAGTNYETAPYIEFGTGPKGRDTPVRGKYPGPIKYRITKWRGKIPGVGWRYISGQPAQPFLYPALRQNEASAPKYIANAIKNKLEGR